MDRKDIALFQLHFINAEAELPEASGQYIVISPWLGLCQMSYSAKYKAWNVTDNDKDTNTQLDVIAWAIPTKKLRNFIDQCRKEGKFSKVKI